MIKAGNVTYDQNSVFPDTIPVFPLTGALLLPGGQLPLNIFEPRYLEMISDAIQSNRLIGMVQPDLSAATAPDENPKLASVGCLGRVTACQETGDGRLLISIAGICRYHVREEEETKKLYRVVKFQVFEKDLDDVVDDEIDREAVLVAFKNFLSANGMEADWETVNSTDNETLITSLCMMSPFQPAEKQALLEAPDLKTRAETLIAISEFYLAQNSSNDAAPSLQ